MIPQINILTVVDVIGALVTGTLTDNLYMTDNRRGRHTAGMGTGALTTEVVPTQVLNWHVIPIDFQTDIRINRILFYRDGALITAANTPCARLQKYGAPSGDYWAGVVNYAHLIEGGQYEYLLELDMGRRMMIMEHFASIHIGTTP
jgi:hypothetical protein